MAKITNYYYLELVTYSSRWDYDVKDIGTYTNLKTAVKHANYQIRFMDAKTMGKDFYRIMRHDGELLRTYRYENGKIKREDVSKYHRFPVIRNI